MSQVVIVSGSSREMSQSLKVAEYLEAELARQEADISVDVIDLASANIPNWDEALWQLGVGFDPHWEAVSTKLKQADAFIIISPEWHGMATAALKNFFLLCSNEELFHKPALLVAVSAGQGGASPISELRMSSYKNNRICYLPEHLIVRHVETVLNDIHQAESEADQMIRDRIAYALRVFRVYMQGFKQISTELVIEETFSTGM